MDTAPTTPKIGVDERRTKMKKPVTSISWRYRLFKLVARAGFERTPYAEIAVPTAKSKDVPSRFLG